MKLNKYIFSDEWKKLTLGGGIVGLIYLLIAIPTGLSGLVNRALFPPVGSLCGVLFGCAVLFLNTLLLEWTVKSVPRRGVKLYTLSYQARYLMKGAALFVGFAWLDPFAVFAVLFSPKITYLFCALTEKKDHVVY